MALFGSENRSEVLAGAFDSDPEAYVAELGLRCDAHAQELARCTAFGRTRYRTGGDDHNFKIWQCKTMSSEATINIRIIEDIRTNLSAVASELTSEPTREKIRVISSVHSRYYDQVAILVSTARDVFTIANTTGRSIDDLAELLALEPVKIHWGDSAASPRQYAFILGKGKLDNEDNIVKMLTTTLQEAEYYWKEIRSKFGQY